MQEIAYFFPAIGALSTLLVLWPQDKADIAAAQARPHETWFWLCALGVCIFSCLCNHGALPLRCGRIWDSLPLPALAFAPFFAGYFALLAGGEAAQNGFGSWIALDALNAFVIVPFGRLFQRARFLNTLRLQGAWGIAALLTGCLCTFVWIWKNRDCTRTWVLVSALLLIATFLC